MQRITYGTSIKYYNRLIIYESQKREKKKREHPAPSSVEIKMVLRSFGMQAIPTFPCKAAPPPDNTNRKRMNSVVVLDKHVWYI